MEHAIYTPPPLTLDDLVAAASRLPDNCVGRECQRGKFVFRVSPIWDGDTLHHAWFYGDLLAKKGAAIKTVGVPTGDE